MQLQHSADSTLPTEVGMIVKKPPLATLSVLALTGIITGLQFAYPQVLTSLERSPSALAQHEYWRLISPLVVHAEGWPQIAFNFTAILIVGTIVERMLGPWRWLLVYFTCGFIGEIAGYAWKPHGAGASVAGAGLLGALGVWLLYLGARKKLRAYFGGAFILVGALALTGMRDLHGPPILAGAALGFFFLRTAKRNAEGR